MDIMVARMIDYSNSIAFSKTKLNLLNSFLAKIGKGRLFFVWHYSPKNYDASMSYKLNFLTMLLNICSLFYDCMPWFLCTKPNTIKKNLGDIINDITSIDYSDLKRNVILINQLRNRMCHNTVKKDFEYFQEVFISIDNSLIIKDWLSFNFSDNIWEKCFNYFLRPIDEYFDNILKFFNNENLSVLNYDDDVWNTIISTCYTQDDDFVTSIELLALSDLYNLRKSKNKFSVNGAKSVQIERWKRMLNSDAIRSQALKNNINILSRDEIRPEKFFLSIISALI